MGCAGGRQAGGPPLWQPMEYRDLGTSLSLLSSALPWPEVAGMGIGKLIGFFSVSFLSVVLVVFSTGSVSPSTLSPENWDQYDFAFLQRKEEDGSRNQSSDDWCNSCIFKLLATFPLCMCH